MGNINSFSVNNEARCNEKTKAILFELPQFVSDYFSTRRQNTTPRTKLSYAYDLKTFFKWLSEIHLNNKYDNIKVIPIESVYSLKVRDLDRYMQYVTDELQNAPSGTARKISAVSSLFKYFCKRDYIEANPCIMLEKPKLAKEQRIIRMQTYEVSLFLNAIKNGHPGIPERQSKFLEKTRMRDYTIAALLLGTGIRVSECAALDIDHFYFKRHEFDVFRKGNKYATLSMSNEVEDVVAEYLEVRKLMKAADDDGKKAMFLSSTKNTRLTIESIEIMIKKYAKYIGCEYLITPHKLRKTYGTRLYELTGDINYVAEKLGHNDINTTKNHYIAPTKAREQRNLISWDEKPPDDE